MITADHNPKPAYLRLRAPAKKGDQVQKTGAADDETASYTGKSLLCNNCRQYITCEEQGLVVNGSQIHTFTNPENFIFRIGCFAKAPGCVYRGMPTMQHTWFASHSWRYAECSSCRLHLGWHFQNKKGGDFSGLILALLSAGY